MALRKSLIPVGVDEKASAPVLGLRYKKVKAVITILIPTKSSYYF